MAQGTNEQRDEIGAADSQRIGCPSWRFTKDRVEKAFADSSGAAGSAKAGFGRDCGSLAVENDTLGHERAMAAPIAQELSLIHI